MELLAVLPVINFPTLGCIAHLIGEARGRPCASSAILRSVSAWGSPFIKSTGRVSPCFRRARICTRASLRGRPGRSSPVIHTTSVGRPLLVRAACLLSPRARSRTAWTAGLSPRNGPGLLSSAIVGDVTFETISAMPVKIQATSCAMVWIVPMRTELTNCSRSRRLRLPPTMRPAKHRWLPQCLPPRDGRRARRPAAVRSRC